MGKHLKIMNKRMVLLNPVSHIFSFLYILYFRNLSLKKKNNSSCSNRQREKLKQCKNKNIRNRVRLLKLRLLKRVHLLKQRLFKRIQNSQKRRYRLLKKSNHYRIQNLSKRSKLMKLYSNKMIQKSFLKQTRLSERKR
jgi:hypothetical protein